MARDALVCPGCGTPHPFDERFCRVCGLPLVHAPSERAERPVSDAHARARKIKPQYSEGELVAVARGRNQAEAEFVQGLLLEEGVPSMLKRSRGFDVPDMLAAGPRDVYVPLSGADTARDVLLQADLLDRGVAAPEQPWRVAALVAGMVALVALIAWIGADVLGG